MNTESDDVIVYVTYRGSPHDQFDRSYYAERHLPLVTKTWAPHGLRSAAVFYPAVPADGTIAICECRFRDEDAVAACLAAPEIAVVMADVATFTDLRPVWLTVAPAKSGPGG
jgi:uncharacterized protein (TIGR02118 family)